MLFRRSLSRVLCCAVALAMAALASWGHAVPVTSGTGPAGVSATNGADILELWLRADAGTFEDTLGTDPAESLDAVARWADQSGSGHHATQSVAGSRPQFEVGGATNGRPTVNFDGTRTLPIGAYTMTGNETAFIVGLMGDGGLRSFLADPVVNRGYTYGNDGAINNPGFLFPNPSFTFATSWRVDGAVGQNFGVNSYGVATGTSNPFAGALTALSVGSGHGGATPHLGETAEIIIFDSGINTARRILVENYLSSKYDLAIDTAGGGTDVYGGDTSGNGHHDFSVFGVGRVGGVQHLDADGGGPNSGIGAAGFGFEVAALADNEWLLAGHNGDNSTSMIVDGNGLTRWGRTWFIDKASVDGIDATLAFDFSDAGIAFPTLSDAEALALFYAAPGSGDYVRLGVSGTASGDTYSFALADSLLLDGSYTLAIVAVPEPGALTLLTVGVVGVWWQSQRRKAKRN